MQVKNISDIKYFTEKFDLMDYPFKHQFNYHPDAPIKTFTSPTTFMAEFMNCKVNSLPLLITEDNEMITDHVWPLVHKEKHKPEKSHPVCAPLNDSHACDSVPFGSYDERISTAAHKH